MVEPYGASHPNISEYPNANEINKDTLKRLETSHIQTPESLEVKIKIHFKRE